SYPVAQVQLHLVGAGERHLRRGHLGPELQWDREGSFELRQSDARVVPLARGHQRAPLSVLEGGPPPSIRRTALLVARWQSRGSARDPTERARGVRARLVEAEA